MSNSIEYCVANLIKLTVYVSNNPSNYCRCLQRLVVLYKGKISLRSDSPSQYGCRTRSPLLWMLNRILDLYTTRLIELLYVHSLFLASWASKNNRLSSITKFNSCSIFMFISNGSTQVHLINFRVTRSMRKRHTHA